VKIECRMKMFLKKQILEPIVIAVLFFSL